jgi:hypothetical protein
VSEPITYWERRRAGVYDQMAAERAAELEARAAAVEPQEAPAVREHVPIGGDVELTEYIEETAGDSSGGGSLAGLSDVTGEPGPGKSPVGDNSGMFPLVPVTTQDDLDAVLAEVAAVSWHNIGDPGEPPFLSEFRNIGDPWSPLRYRVLANSTVRMQGTVCCDDQTIGSSTWVPIFTLPAAVAPDYSLEFCALTNDTAFSKLYIWDTGDVIWGGYVNTSGSMPTDPVGRLPLNFLSWSTTGPAPMLAAALEARR